MRALPALIGLIVLAAPSGAQEVKESTVSGTLVSHSVTVPSGEESAEIFSVPSGATFIMTQACAESPFSLITPIPRTVGSTTVRIVGSELGVVPVVSCEAFHPGIAFRAEEVISCQLPFTTLADISCLVTGVLQTDRSRGHGPPWSR